MLTMHQIALNRINQTIEQKKSKLLAYNVILPDPEYLNLIQDRARLIIQDAQGATFQKRFAVTFMNRTAQLDTKPEQTDLPIFSKEPIRPPSRISLLSPLNFPSSASMQTNSPGYNSPVPLSSGHATPAMHLTQPHKSLEPIPDGHTDDQDLFEGFSYAGTSSSNLPTNTQDFPKTTDHNITGCDPFGSFNYQRTPSPERSTHIAESLNKADQETATHDLFDGFNYQGTSSSNVSTNDQETSSIAFLDDSSYDTKIKQTLRSISTNIEALELEYLKEKQIELSTRIAHIESQLHNTVNEKDILNYIELSKQLATVEYRISYEVQFSIDSDSECDSDENAAFTLSGCSITF